MLRNSPPNLNACKPFVMLSVSAYDHKGAVLPRLEPVPIKLLEKFTGLGMNDMPLLDGSLKYPFGLAGSHAVKASFEESRFPKRNSFTIAGDKIETKDSEYTCGFLMTHPLNPSGHIETPVGFVDV